MFTAKLQEMENEEMEKLYADMDLKKIKWKKLRHMDNMEEASRHGRR
jgi:hypothetical protein